jgi:hypothetical protein
MKNFIFQIYMQTLNKNMAWVETLSLSDYRRDAVIVAGDISRSPHLFSRVIDGVRYVSYCLGYPRERADSRIVCLTGEPLLVWERG